MFIPPLKQRWPYIITQVHSTTMEKKKRSYNNPSFACAPKIGISKRKINGSFTIKIQVPTTSRFKKWLYFTSKGIKIWLSYFTTRSLTLSWPRKPMTHFSPLNLNPTLGPYILWTLVVVMDSINDKKGPIDPLSF